MRDADGFICLRPVLDTESIQEPKTKKAKWIGEHEILPGAHQGTPSAREVSSYRMSSKNVEYHIEYQPKTWQFKAWSLLSRGLDLTAKSAFREMKGNKKFRHILRIGLAMKVRSDDVNTKSIVFGQFGTAGGPHGIYCKADTPAEFKVLADRWSHMIYDNVDSYLDMARKQGVDMILYIPKIFIIYDDMTYDTRMGDPRYLYTYLGLKTDKKGRVIL